MPADADIIIPFVGATDAERAGAFHERTLGLRFAREEPGHALVFHAGRTMLRVSLVTAVPPARFTVLGWRVVDITAAVDTLVDRGVPFERFEGFAQDERGVWTAPDGTRVAWFKDPDGNMLSLTQFDQTPPPD